MEKIPTAQEWNELATSLAREVDLEEARARWDDGAAGFARREGSNGRYVPELMEAMRLQPGESVFDMGCGPGMLAIPLAQAGHDVVAVDFSEGMLTLLEERALAAGVADRIKTFRRAWQDDWSDLPQADVVVASRSMELGNIAAAVAKMESKAKSRVVATHAAASAVWTDAELEKLEKSGSPKGPGKRRPAEFVILMNYLLASGKLPTLCYIGDVKHPQADTEEELRQMLRKQISPADEAGKLALEAFLDKHAQCREAGFWELDAGRDVPRSVITWAV